MELYQLEYFLEAARQKSFTRAAARLNLAQAALSEQMRKLEQELGTPLFHRGRRESVLTAAGETLRPRAEALLAQAAAARCAVQAEAGLRAGRLAIAAIPSVSACLLPAAIAAFRRRYPDIELTLAEGTSEAITEWLESGRVELGIVQRPAGSGRFDERPLFSEPFVLLLPATHPAAARRSLALQDLSRESFVFYRGRARDTAMAACRAAGFEPRVACESGEMETVRALVAAGLGIAIIPRLSARPDAGTAVVKLQSPSTTRDIAVLSRKSFALSPAAEAFLPLLKKATTPSRQSPAK